MAISFVGSKTFSAVGANSGTFSSSLTDLLDASGSPATLQQGDLVIINNVVGGTTDKSSAIMMASGFTGVAPSDGSGQYANSTNDTNLQVQYKVMGASPDTSAVIPRSGSTADAQGGTIFALRGTSAAPASSSAATGTGTGRPNAPSVTPTVAGSWVMVCGGAAAGAGAVFTNPGDLSATTNHFLSVASGDTVDAMAGCGIKTDWASGAFDPAQWGGGTTGAGDSWAAVTLVIEPAAAVSHATSGALTGQIGSVAGTASSKTTRPSTGALTGQIGSVAGSAARTRQHATTGVLAGQGATVAGSAAKSGQPVSHGTSGGLVGQGAAIASDAARLRAFGAIGALAGPGAEVSGSASLSAAPVTHSTSGTLIAQGAVIAAMALSSGTTIARPFITGWRDRRKASRSRR